MSECCKKKLRDEDRKKALINRTNRIEGQIKGIKNMLESDRYCVDILVQISAVRAALDSLGKELLNEHISSCVVNGIKNGDEKVIEELCDTVNKFIK